MAKEKPIVWGKEWLGYPLVWKAEGNECFTVVRLDNLSHHSGTSPGSRISSLVPLLAAPLVRRGLQTLLRPSRDRGPSP